MKKERICTGQLNDFDIEELDDGRLQDVTGGSTNWFGCENPVDCSESSNIFACQNPEVCLTET